MDSFPDDFSPLTIDTEKAQEKLYRDAFDVRLNAFRQRKNLFECKFTFSSEEVDNPQLVNEYIEKMKQIVAERDSSAVLIVEYWEGMPDISAFTNDSGSTAQIDPKNFRISVSVKSQEDYKAEVDDCTRTLRALLVKQIKNKDNTEHKARVPYNLYESSMETVKSELESRSWQITIMRRYRGVNCNRGMVVFEMAPPQLGGGEVPVTAVGSGQQDLRTPEEKMRDTRLAKFETKEIEVCECSDSEDDKEDSCECGAEGIFGNQSPPPPPINVNMLGTSPTEVPEYKPIDITQFNTTRVPAPWEKK